MMKVMSTQVGDVRIEQDPLEEVEHFRYFGSVINKTGSTDEDILARIGKQGKARQVFVILT